ncbi:MAG TPA: ribulose-phosphate 3-epimerase [Sulfurihydrogenibium sp.]|uniref:ribulose-phosphate 3-epimerase n=1 Tax=Sulfurihydrogenibium sp. (strain YO3AOP1) TaxID=436114 RepID=UPI0001724183|nr:ribulose-phosphate 3-epimerase [Sulfurihydrogenibium sp. YO3AOP1]ACD67109.1 Ribulose-phosphate 3-epimerase [Sulfurihydrogenibium sp. YO3AOP1]HBT98846.1 ribulose-phosphate 3-epimerase [Sulfurihydrogenibium sp.]
MKLLAPSILSADFSILGQQIKEVEEAGADIIHLDIMDGRYVPNITFGPPVVESIRKITDLPFDAHLMIVEPEKYIPDFIKAGVNMISFHMDATIHAHRVVDMIKSNDVKAGVVLNPATPVNTLEEIIYYIDYVLIMSVNPGFGGQKFIPQTAEKVKKLKLLMEETNRTDILIEIDGGVNQDNINYLSMLGVNIFVAGNAVFKGNIKENVVNLKRKMEICV